MKHGTCLENLDTIMAYYGLLWFIMAYYGLLYILLWFINVYYGLLYYGYYGSLWFIERKLKGNMEDLWNSGRYNGL